MPASYDEAEMEMTARAVTLFQRPQNFPVKDPSNFENGMTTDPLMTSHQSQSRNSSKPAIISMVLESLVAKFKNKDTFSDTTIADNNNNITTMDAGLTRATSKKINALKAQQEKREEADAINHHWTNACCVVACLSVATALTSMLIYHRPIIRIAFVFPLITAPYVIGQRRQLNKLPYFKECTARLRIRLDRLRQQNQNLQQEQEQLKQNLNRLKVAENKLESMVRQQQGSMKQVKELVKENGEITRKMHQLNESQKLQQLVASYMKSKRNGDFQLSEDEINEFIQRLQNISPRKLDANKLRQAFSKSKSSSSIMGGLDYHLSVEEMSEYEAFTFPRRSSEELQRTGGMRMNINAPII